MAIILLDMAMSLDGFIAGPNDEPQCTEAGLVDEIQIHLVPVLLGEGIRLFEHPGAEQSEPERTRVIEPPFATHLRFRVVKEN